MGAHWHLETAESMTEQGLQVRQGLFCHSVKSRWMFFSCSAVWPTLQRGDREEKGLADLETISLHCGRRWDPSAGLGSGGVSVDGSTPSLPHCS